MSEQIFLNKKELALRVGITLPTLTSWMDRYSDFPVHKTGSNGSSYKFNAAEVFEFLAKKREEEREKSDQRDNQLANLQLQLFPESEPQAKAISHSEIKTKIDETKLFRLRREEAERCGKLVVASEIHELVSNVLARLNRETRIFIKRLGRQGGIPETIINQKLLEFSGMQKALISEISTALKNGDELNTGDDNDDTLL